MDSYQAIYDAVRSKISGGDVGSAIQEVARNAFDISWALDAVKQEYLDEWGQGSQEHNIARDFVTLAKREIQAAEQRGAKRERERCLREAEDADPLGKDAFGMREYIAQAIRQGEQA